MKMTFYVLMMMVERLQMKIDKQHNRSFLFGEYLAGMAG
jgi:hypothetical protein